MAFFTSRSAVHTLRRGSVVPCRGLIPPSVAGIVAKPPQLLCRRNFGMISNWFTNKLSFGYKIRGVKARTDFKPKGILVYKAKKQSFLKHLFFGSCVFASVFTGIAIYDWIFPIENYVQSYLVMAIGALTAWLFPMFILPAYGKRVVTRMWLEKQWWIHIESHNRFGGQRYVRIPIGFARVPEKQLLLTTVKGLRRYVLGCKIYNEWGFYYLRKSGRFLDGAALKVMWGENVIELLQESRLLKPIALPPQIMDDTLFPPTHTAHIYDIELDKIRADPMPMEEGIWQKLKFWNAISRYFARRKQLKRQKQRLALSGDSDLSLDSEQSLKWYQRKPLSEEALDWKADPIRKLPIFQSEPEKYTRFTDMDLFTEREIGMMKEYRQLTMIDRPEKEANDISDATDGSIDELSHPSDPQKKMKFTIGYSQHTSQLKKQLLINGDESIDANEMQTLQSSMTPTPAVRRGYVLSQYAQTDRERDEIQSLLIELKNSPRNRKIERGGRDGNTYFINRYKNKVGRRYWHRTEGNKWRPRRLGKKRWSNQWWQRMIFD